VPLLVFYFKLFDYLRKKGGNDMGRLKRAASFILAGIMTLSMTACGGGSTGASSVTSGKTASDSDLLKVALAVNPPTLDPWLSFMKVCLNWTRI
jgi:hypothetical protein